jgi:hypothetical protein
MSSVLPGARVPQVEEQWHIPLNTTQVITSSNMEMSGTRSMEGKIRNTIFGGGWKSWMDERLWARKVRRYHTSPDRHK